MVPVRIEGARRNFGIIGISSVYMYTVTLVDEPGQRIYNLGVERHEALPIVAALHNLALPRPLTIHVMVDTLKLQGITPRLGYSKTPMRDALVKEFKASLLGKSPPFPEDDLAQRKKEYLAFLLKENV